MEGSIGELLWIGFAERMVWPEWRMKVVLRLRVLVHKVASSEMPGEIGPSWVHDDG